jgi:hypothetical protein
MGGTTRQQRDRLMEKLADLLEQESPEERAQTMRAAIETWVASNLIPAEVAGLIRTGDPLDFALDLVGDNEALPSHLNLRPMRVIRQAMEARSALQLVQTLA